VRTGILSEMSNKKNLGNARTRVCRKYKLLSLFVKAVSRNRYRLFITSFL
jgi:hypothetical protein